MIRTKFLEMEAAKLEMQKEYSIQYMTNTGNAIIVDPGTVNKNEQILTTDQNSSEE